MKTVKYIRQNEVNDIFEISEEGKEVDYIKFPRTMEMTTEDVKEYIN